MMIIGAFALVIGLSLYTLLDAARTPAADARTLPKWLWIIVIIFFPIVGPVFLAVLRQARSEKSAAEQPPAADTGRGLKGRRGTVPPAPKAQTTMKSTCAGSKPKQNGKNETGSGKNPATTPQITLTARNSSGFQTVSQCCLLPCFRHRNVLRPERDANNVGYSNPVCR